VLLQMSFVLTASIKLFKVRINLYHRISDKMQFPCDLLDFRRIRKFEKNAS